jgi:hypothetical protein
VDPDQDVEEAAVGHVARLRRQISYGDGAGKRVPHFLLVALVDPLESDVDIAGLQGATAVDSRGTVLGVAVGGRGADEQAEQLAIFMFPPCSAAFRR